MIEVTSIQLRGARPEVLATTGEEIKRLTDLYLAIIQHGNGSCSGSCSCPHPRQAKIEEMGAELVAMLRKHSLTYQECCMVLFSELFSIEGFARVLFDDDDDPNQGFDPDEPPHNRENDVDPPSDPNWTPEITPDTSAPGVDEGGAE